jgi:hypothetical protein
VAALLRASALLLAGLALAACGNRSGPDDPAVAVGTGIPVGALSAGGVSFDAPVDRADALPQSGDRIETAPKPLPLPTPIDPFDPAPTPPPIKAPKKKGTSL